MREGGDHGFHQLSKALGNQKRSRTVALEGRKKAEFRMLEATCSTCRPFLPSHPSSITNLVPMAPQSCRLTQASRTLGARAAPRQLVPAWKLQQVSARRVSSACPRSPQGEWDGSLPLRPPGHRSFSRLRDVCCTSLPTTLRGLQPLGCHKLL